MFNYAYEKLEAINFSEYYEDCAGGSILQGDIISDGETNNFTITFELYICKDWQKIKDKKQLDFN